MDKVESQETIKTEPMILKITSPLPNSCFYAFESDNSYKYFEGCLSEENFKELMKVREELKNHIRTPEDYAQLVKSVYTEEHGHMEHLSNRVGSILDEETYGARLQKVLSNIGPIIKEQTESNPLFTPDYYLKAVQQHPELEKSQILLSRFRKFCGAHSHYIGEEITAVIAWQPPVEKGKGMVSSRAYPNSELMVIGVPSNATANDISVGGIFHESIHMIFQEESTDTNEAMKNAGFFDNLNEDQKQIVANDLGEALAYLFHYDFYEEEVKGSNGRINELIISGNRPPIVLKQLRYANELKPLVKDYMNSGKSIDESFFKSACKIYKELGEKRE